MLRKHQVFSRVKATFTFSINRFGQKAGGITWDKHQEAATRKNTFQAIECWLHLTIHFSIRGESNLIK